MNFLEHIRMLDDKIAEVHCGKYLLCGKRFIPRISASTYNSATRNMLVNRIYFTSLQILPALVTTFVILWHRKPTSKFFGKEGTLPQINKIPKNVASKLEKLNASVDNINKISKESSEGMKDFSILCSGTDKALEDVAREIDAILSPEKSN